MRALSDLLRQGDGIYQMMQVTGEEGVTLQDFVTYQKATFVDMVYLQQDAFDPVDASTSQARQREAFELVRSLVQRDYPFKDKEEARAFFTRLTGLVKNLNYAPSGSPEHAARLVEIEEQVETLGRSAAPADRGRLPAEGAQAAAPTIH